MPIMQSPPRSIDASEQDDWKIPPSISNWKVNFYLFHELGVSFNMVCLQNPKGYTIPLDKRLAADGRGLQEVQIRIVLEGIRRQILEALEVLIRQEEEVRGLSGQGTREIR